jgi:hypothetical protein
MIKHETDLISIVYFGSIKYHISYSAKHHLKILHMSRIYPSGALDVIPSFNGGVYFAFLLSLFVFYLFV